MYWMTHGIFLCAGVFFFMDDGGIPKRKKGMPRYMQFRPLLRLVGYVCGPIGAFVFHLVDAFVPSDQKKFLQ